MLRCCRRGAALMSSRPARSSAASAGHFGAPPGHDSPARRTHSVPPLGPAAIGQSRPAAGNCNLSTLIPRTCFGSNAKWGTARFPTPFLTSQWGGAFLLGVPTQGKSPHGTVRLRSRQQYMNASSMSKGSEPNDPKTSPAAPCPTSSNENDDKEEKYPSKDAHESSVGASRADFGSADDNASMFNLEAQFANTDRSDLRAMREKLSRSFEGRQSMQEDVVAAYAAIEAQEKREHEAAFLSQPELSYTAVTRALAGNLVITVLKFGVYLRTGSAAMLSEAVHTLVDSGNQAILLIGIRQMSNASDQRHPYGYGRAAFFWGLVSALGMFWVGSGVSIMHGVTELVHPPEAVIDSGWETWSVLALSFAIDGYVLGKTVLDMKKTMPSGMSFFDYCKQIRDPFVMAVLLEDMAATTGVLVAVGGIGMTALTGNSAFDSLASIGVGGLLGAVAMYLARMNQRFLLGQAIDRSVEDSIRGIILSRPSIEAVHSIQSQWMGPSAFSFKAEVDFDGTYPAARLLKTYTPVFEDLAAQGTMRADLPVVLGWYAEDVTRILETEVKEAEASIREKYPDAAYIELEPDSKDAEDRMSRRLKRYGEKGGRGGVKRSHWDQERQEMMRMSQMVELTRMLDGSSSTSEPRYFESEREGTGIDRERDKGSNSNDHGGGSSRGAGGG